MKKFKVAVVGPIPRDHITTHLNEEFDKYGCVTHTTIVLSKLLEDNGEVIPVSHVRKKDENVILRVLKPYENVATSHITSEADQGDVINLVFLDQNRREEKQVAFMNPIERSDFEGLLDCDAFVFVPVTNFEVPLDTVKYLKENSNGSIIFDAHGPINAVSITGDRTMNFWVQRDLWLPYIDILKMNLEEAYCSWFDKEYTLDELQTLPQLQREKIPLLAMHCLSYGVKAVFVTIDSDGVLGYWLENGKLREELVPPVYMENIVQTTGCGDSFAGGLAYGILSDPTNYPSAARYGNAVGAQRTQGTTFEVFKSREETDQMIEKTYGRS